MKENDPDETTVWYEPVDADDDMTLRPHPLQRLEWAIQDLPDEQAQLVRWRYLEGLPVSMIARRVGSRVGLVRAQLASIMRWLMTPPEDVTRVEG